MEPVNSKYHGNCRCGSIQFEIHADVSALSSCACAVCTQEDAAVIGVHEFNFKLMKGVGALYCSEADHGAVKRYFCKTCRVSPFHRNSDAPDEIAINLSCLQDLDIDAIKLQALMVA